ncbi:hypothetical protein [Methylocapsa acidiphila]|uniref:hypothetical protein n=1 Tax=Methylocapsa acidiphila TaxID=133552 RepID=UPI0012EC0155|nr:hypothetical protein [Methylocapsa acidiphila]
MQKSGLRDFGAIVPSFSENKPVAPAAPAPPAAAPSSHPPSASPAPVFTSDAKDPAGGAGPDAELDLLAELALHAGAETPLTIGLLGRSGTGKSLALTRLLASIEALSAAARRAGETPFLSKVVTVKIDAADIEGSPTIALAGALHARLAAVAPAFAAEAVHAASDPRSAARDAFERLDAARRKLEAEKGALGEAEGRRAKLTETLLYESSGSQVDAFARANRTRIKTALAAFGVTGDPVRDYKDMIRAIADRDGGGRTGFALRSFWSLKGQARLITLAIFLALIGIGLGEAYAQQAAWLGWLRTNDQFATAASWLENHLDWIPTLRTAAFLAAALALGVNLWRALRLIQLTFRGERLLQEELFARRRESDGHFGHQTRRVEALTAEVETLTRRAAEAERRAGGLQPDHSAATEPPPFALDLVKQQAQRFIAAVGAMIQKRGRLAEDDKSAAAIDAPQRIVLALDNLDAAPTARACEILAQARAALGPGFVALIAANPARFRIAGSDADCGLDRWIQAPFQVGETAARSDYGALVRNILGQGAAPTQEPPRDATQSALDVPMSEAEAELLAELAPLAGGSARAVKRFVNLYRLARTRAEEGRDHKGALALMLALDAGGTQGEIAAMTDALSGPRGEISVDLLQGGPRLTRALAAVQAAYGKIGVEAARRAAAVARIFSFHA